MPPAPDVLHVLIVDDERPARQRLLALLEREAGVEVAGTAATGTDAVAALQAHRSAGTPVDVVFLDVQMPGATGIDVVREVGPEAMPVTVFVTAYDEHALAAFELAALDYLLKPFDNERFRQTLARAREAVRLHKLDAIHGRLRTLLDAAPRSAAAPPTAPPAAPPAASYLQRIAVEMRGQVRVVPVERIDHVAAEGNYVRLVAGDDEYFINDTLSSLEERLDPADFFRIHRSTIVRLDRVEALLTAPGGDYAVRLHDGTRLRVARGRRDDLASRLGLGA